MQGRAQNTTQQNKTIQIQIKTRQDNLLLPIFSVIRTSQDVRAPVLGGDVDALGTAMAAPSPRTIFVGGWVRTRTLPPTQATHQSTVEVLQRGLPEGGVVGQIRNIGDERHLLVVRWHP